LCYFNRPVNQPFTAKRKKSILVNTIKTVYEIDKKYFGGALTAYLMQWHSLFPNQREA
jgi:hypothetical protein